MHFASRKRATFAAFFPKTAGRHEGVEALMLDFRDLTIHFVHLRESREAFSGARLHAS